MKRRNFIKNVIKACTVAVIVPVVSINTIDTVGLKGVPIKVIMSEKYFLDYEVFEAQRKFMEEQERELWDWWFNRQYLNDD